MAVTPLIEPAVERLRAQATRAGLTLTLVLPEDLPQVMVDADRIRQVVINLVHNAIKFTLPGGYITVTARLGRDGGRDGVVVSVADTGTGIPAEDVPRIFERFYKADRARSGGGTGLGLAIAKHTIQAHNGRLWVESTEGKGSTFSFTLPPANLPLTQL
jgi:two-component system phosphate regulon sensor histidine kinase PhoR